MIIAVTGGTGFIGKALVKQLVRYGQRVRLILRRESQLGELSSLPLETIEADLSNLNSLIQALEGCSQLFHLAAFARGWAPDSEFFRKINVEGLKNILEASISCGVQRVVYVSSSVVKGPSVEEPVTEAASRENTPFFTLYEESKALSEKIIPGFLERGLEVLIARPTRVYGPGPLTEANSVTKLIRIFLKFRLCLILDRGEEIGNYVYVEDVARGLRLMMEKGQNGEDYILGGENISLRGFYELLEEVSGVRPLKVRIPAGAARKLARFESWKAHKFALYPLITEGWVETFLQNWAFSHEKASRELGYQPLNLREGLKLTCLWLAGRKK